MCQLWQYTLSWRPWAYSYIFYSYISNWFVKFVVFNDATTAAIELIIYVWSFTRCISADFGVLGYDREAPGLFHKYYKVWSEPKGLEAYNVCRNSFFFLCARDQPLHIILFYIVVAGLGHISVLYDCCRWLSTQ